MDRSIARDLTKCIGKDITVRSDGDDVIADGILLYSPRGNSSQGFLVGDTYSLSVESVKYIFPIHQGESARIVLKPASRNDARRAA